jgi:DNA-directed RNA polymerase subunit RPC12/RpoP
MLDKCPGSGNIRIPIPSYKECPECGKEVEIWSDEVRAKCTRCGAAVFRENEPSCIEWCKYAKECIGEGKYFFFM